jgi:hypothetical protein
MEQSGLDRTAQRLTRSQHLALPDKLIQGTRPHPIRERPQRLTDAHGERQNRPSIQRAQYPRPR